LAEALLRFDATNPRAIAAAETQAAELVVGVNAATRQAIRDAVARAIAEGRSPAVLARELRDLVGLTPRDAQAVLNFRAHELARGVSQSVVDRRAARYADRLLRRRALTIARTETLRATNAGQKELWLQARDSGQLSPDQKRTWLHNTRRHEDRAGEVVGIEEPWPWGTEPGDEVNCGCGQALVFGAEAAQ
jgi:uncharacterized protein with gpF-like domain